jgi:hypothetical protein
MSNTNKPNPPRVPNVAPTQRFETNDIEIEGDKPVAIDEIRSYNASGGLDLEQITGGSATTEQIELEAFMNETLVIVVQESADEEALPIVTLTVNGVTQPIMRGIATPVKRKYVEALARAKETKYKQSLSDPSDPSSIAMIPRSALAYPFVVERDPNPNGFAWLREVLKQPA